MGDQIKILILMSYYNRPILVKNSLKSILEADKYHQNWELFFGDDGSKIPGKPIVEELLHSCIDKVKFVNSNLTIKEKIKSGLVLGKYANQAIKESDADVAIMLCDDDQLVPDYLYNLNNYFKNNNEVLYCYSKIYLINPLVKNYLYTKEVNNKYNQWIGSINPAGKVDATQVAWRLQCCKEHNAWFSESTKFVPGKPWTKDTDKSFFENLYDCCGPCHPTNFYSQYKGIHDYQLLWHKNVSEESLIAYDMMCETLAGEKF